jgi:nucleoside phosphorylase
MSVTLNPEDYTVVWIAPLGIEKQAAIRMLDKEHPGDFPTQQGDDYLYVAGEINGHNVVIASFPAGHDYGNSSAAALASQVKNTFRNLWFGVLVGVAAGIPNLSGDPPLDIRLGDVLVAVGNSEYAGIIRFDLGKEKGDKYEVLRCGMITKTIPIVRAAIGRIRDAPPERGDAFLEHYNRMKDKKWRYDNREGTFTDPGDHTTVDGTNGPASKRNRVWYGSIGSGDKLMKNAKKRDFLRDEYKIIGLEMEAAGTVEVIPVGVIRGVCDYGDESKSKEWQPYAAAMAAAYAKEVLYKIRPTKAPRRQMG